MCAKASDSSNKYERILNAAVKVFARKGFFRSKISEVAREAGIADGTVYLYFKNKNDILLSIFTTKIEETFARCRDAVAEMDDARSRLECLLEMYLAEFQANPDLATVFRLEFHQSRRFMPESRKTRFRQFSNLRADARS